MTTTSDTSLPKHWKTLQVTAPTLDFNPETLAQEWTGGEVLCWNEKSGVTFRCAPGDVHALATAASEAE